MSSPDGDEMSAALQEFARQRDRLAELAQQMDTTMVEVSTPDGRIAVSATLSGLVSDLRFEGDAHRDLSGPELAALLLDLLAQARQIAEAQADRAAGSLASSGPVGPVDLAGSMVPGDPLGDALAELGSLFRRGPRPEGAGEAPR